MNHKVRIICIALVQIRSNGEKFGLLEFGILFPKSIQFNVNFLRIIIGILLFHLNLKIDISFVTQCAIHTFGFYYHFTPFQIRLKKYLKFALLIQHLKVKNTALQCGTCMWFLYALQHSLYLSKTFDFRWFYIKVPK